MNDSQYDSLLGGRQDLPSTINLLKFTTARCKEIDAMKKALTTSSGTKLAFQKLPKHMRRRVMSHNAKRVPRRLREIHMNQLTKSGLPPKQKRPSRKYRRRPYNLLNEYVRRKQRIKWLETHIWHAKRFHMVEKWGYKIADRPCDKAFRACYRATAKHCLLQDVSYYTCLEIKGPLDVLVPKVKSLCDSSGLSMGAKAFQNGSREGKTVLYKCCVSPKKAIGTVCFHWGPAVKENWGKIWIWGHPSYYTEMLHAFVECFALEAHAVSEIFAESYTNEATEVVLTELKNSLNRFRLTGPLAHHVLQKSLKITPANMNCEWFSDYLNDANSRQNFADQIEYWNNISNVSNAAVLLPHMIISLVVTDPRFNFPKKRVKAVPEQLTVDTNQLCSPPMNICFGPIWKTDVQMCVKESRVSNAAIIENRRQLLIPGTDVSEIGVPVPIILVQQPGHFGYCGGWDVIVPSGWGQAFWLSFIMWGARAGGLRETNSVLFESGFPDFLAPDTTAGKREEELQSHVCREHFFKLPPNKRPNYARYSISSPFSYNWDLLTKEWNVGEEFGSEFFVMRDPKVLSSLQVFLTKEKFANSLDLKINCLIPVKLKLSGRGCPKQFAIITLPDPTDLKQAPTEPIVDDKNYILRRKLRHDHKLLLKTLKRKRHRAKANDYTQKFVSPVELEEYKNRMRELWLPKTESVRYSCSRQVIGFVTKGEFSFVNAKACAVGYVAIGGLFELLCRCKNLVLVRNTNSRQYKFAKLEIAM